MNHSNMAFSSSVPVGQVSRLSRNHPRNGLSSLRMKLEPVADAKLSRRAFVAVFASLPIAYISKSAHGVPDYDAIRTRRYVDLGRPPADRRPPTFVENVPVYPIDQLKVQDIVVGDGDTVKNGSLVVARWVTVLDNGSTLDDSNENRPALFRPGAHQVPPGIEDAVVGMRVGGVRRVYGTAERILT